jgi:hypothetical protein
MIAPSPNGQTAKKGRNPDGRFAEGNPGGPGNPHGKRAAWLREALLNAVTADDIQAIARVLVARAKDGDIPAIRELLDRTIGRSMPAINGADDPDPIMQISDAQIRAVASSMALR